MDGNRWAEDRCCDGRPHRGDDDIARRDSVGLEFLDGRELALELHPGRRRRPCEDRDLVPSSVQPVGYLQRVLDPAPQAFRRLQQEHDSHPRHAGLIGRSASRDERRTRRRGGLVVDAFGTRTARD